ncbi:Hypothetical predicted protein [Cloeon dipterum]|uniref:Uncharacterized protein n=1 Tax=Cloeon dipterum TaxID=197152 RepID=A0A8S1DZP6_9INSE|nr:Hypothetical predicted protein [Cloeon dipterum]
MSKNLFGLTIDVIANNIKHFSAHHEKISQLSKLEKYFIVRRILRLNKRESEKGDDEFDLILNVLPLFLPATPVKNFGIHLENLMTFCPDTASATNSHLTEALQVIATHAPYVSGLTLSARKNLMMDKGYYVLNHSISLDLRELENLEVLQIVDYLIRFRDLAAISKKLKKLTFLEVKIFFDATLYPYKPIRTSNLMINLVRNLDKLKLTANSLIANPHLEIVQSYANDRWRSIYHIIIKPSQNPFSLKHLSVRPRMPRMANGDLNRFFPNVTHLKVVWFDERDLAERYLPNLLHFSNILSLVLFDCPSVQVLDRFLEQYGSNLRNLAIKNFNYNLHCRFGTIFNVCPNLERLALSGVDMLDDSTPLEHFANISMLDWTPKSGRYSILSNILAAPNLEIVDLGSVNFDLEDLKNVATLIAQQKILQNLELFLQNRNPFLDGEEASSSFIQAFQDVVQNAFSYLPKLFEP